MKPFVQDSLGQDAVCRSSSIAKAAACPEASGVARGRKVSKAVEPAAMHAVAKHGDGLSSKQVPADQGFFGLVCNCEH